MTPELELIRDEIADMEDNKADIQMLNALANNLIYVLTKMQRTNDDLSVEQRAEMDTVIVDLLNTMDKELKWAQEDDDEDEQKVWFAKARRHLLRDLNRLFDGY